MSKKILCTVWNCHNEATYGFVWKHSKTGVPGRFKYCGKHAKGMQDCFTQSKLVKL